MKYSGKTDIGLKRKNNQDSFIIVSKKNFLSAVVCDGMGGARGGNIASDLAVKAYTKAIKVSMADITDSVIAEEDAEHIIKNAVEKANSVVFETSNGDNNLEGMGTTLVSVLISGDRAVVANIGDSRLYTYKNGMLKQITNDHSFVQYLLDKGSINKEEAKSHPNRNIILRALGVSEKVEPEMFVLKDEDYDILLLCSDGLTTHLSDAEISDIIEENSSKTISLKKKAESLIEKANYRGGVDNITAVLIGKE